MMQAFGTQTTRALPATLCAAILLLGLAFATPVAAAPADVGSGVTIDITREGDSVVDSTVWVNQAGAIPLVATVTRTGGVPPIDTVTFTIQNRDPDAAVDQYEFLGIDSNQDWPDPTPEDWTGTNGADTLVFQSPGPEPSCTLAQLDCPDLSADPGIFSFTLDIAAGFADVTARDLMVTAAGPEGFVSDEDARFKLGYDGTAPALAAPVFQGWSNGLATISFSVTDALSGLAAITVSAGTLNAACSGDLAGATAKSCTLTVDPAGGAANTVTIDATDRAGNAAVQQQVGPLDATAPLAGAPSQASGLLVKSLGPITFPFTDVGSGVDEAATAATVTVTKDDVALPPTAFTVATNVADQVTVDVPAAASGFYEITVVGKDLAGNQVTQDVWTAQVDTTLDLVRFTNIGITGTGPYLYTVGADDLAVQGAKSASSTVTVTSLTDGDCANAADANHGAVSTANGDLTWSLPLTGLALDNSPALGDCTYVLTVLATDPFGATESAVLQVTRSDIRLVAVELTPSDVFAQTGTTIVLTVQAKDVTTNPDFASAPAAANTRIKLVRDGVEISGVTLLTNGLGTAQYSIASPLASASDTFQAVPTQMLRPGVGFRPVQDASSLAGSSEQVVWTRLVAGTAGISSSGVTDRGSPLTLSLPLTWQHDGSAATGLDSVSNTIGWSLAGTDAGSADALVPDVPSTAVLAGVTNAGSGVYQLVYTHRDGASLPLVEQVAFTSTGSVPSYVHAAGDAPSSFTVPTNATLTGNWIGARAGPATLSNLGPDGLGVLDATDGFVNEDDRVRITIPVSYTQNLAGDATGAAVSLFTTGTLAGPVAPAGNGDAFATVSDGSACDQDPANGIVAIDIGATAGACVFALAGIPTTFGIAALATALTPAAGVTLTQSIVAADGDDTEDDRADFGTDLAPLTFTGIDVAYVADSVMGPGVADTSSAARWWLNADADAAGTAADLLTLQVQATWTHDASAAEGALVGAFQDVDGTPVLATVGGAPLVGTLTDVAGVSTFTFDPDTYALDYLVTDLEFRVLRAPEPGFVLGDAPGFAVPAGGEAITFFDEAGTFEQQVLWTKIHLELSNDLADDTANLGEAIFVTVTASWYHDENGDEASFFAGSPAASWDPAPAALMDFTLVDTVASGLGLLTQDDVSSDIGGHQAFVSPFRGCDPLAGTALAACLADKTAAQAGWHTFFADASDTPHGVSDDYTVDGPGAAAVDSEDLLWTAAVLDLTTTRLLQDAGTAIDGAVQAYFVHAHEADGTAMTLAERALPYDIQSVVVDVAGGDAADITGLTVPSLAGVDVALLRSTAGTVTAVAQADAEPVPGSHILDPDALGTGYPVYTVFESATLTRNFAELTIVPGVSESVDDIDYDGDGDKLDALFIEDAVSLRGDLVDVSIQLSLDLGAGPVNVDDAFAGAGFSQTDTPVAGTDMPVRQLTSTAVPLGAQDILSVLGDEVVNTPPTDLDREDGSAEFAYDGGCACWTATIPAHLLLEEGILYDIAATLQVASAVDIVTTYLGIEAAPETLPGETTLSDADADAFSTTTTAILVTLRDSVNRDEAGVADGHGEVPTDAPADVWVDFDGSNLYRVDAHWAHSSDGDDASFIRDGVIDDGDNVQGATLATSHGITPSETAPGLYEASLDSADTPIARDYVFRVDAVDDPSSGDPAQTFAHVDNVLLNEATITQAVHHARFDLAYASLADIVANVDDNIELAFQVTWAQGDDMEGTTVWEFPSSGDHAFTSEEGVGNALLVSETTLVTQLFAPAAQPVLEATGPDGFLAPHGITAYAVPTTDPTAPQLIWTRIEVTGVDDGTATSTATGLDACSGGLATYDPPGAATSDCDVFPAGATVTQPAHFQFDHDDSAASGAMVLVGGQVKTASATGDAAASFRSFSDGWLLVEGRALEATLGGTSITATLPAQNYVGFDAGAAGIP